MLYHLTKIFNKATHYGIVYLDSPKYQYRDHDQRMEMAIVKILDEFINEYGGIDGYKKLYHTMSDHPNDIKQRDAMRDIIDAYEWFFIDRKTSDLIIDALEEKIGKLMTIEMQDDCLAIISDKVDDALADEYQKMVSTMKSTDDKHLINVIKHRDFMWI